MTTTTDTTFEHDVLRAERPVVVDFGAPRCPPCDAAAAVLEGLAADWGDAVSLVRMDIEQNPDTAFRFAVLSVPTAILFEGGEARSTVVGARSRSHYEREWAPWLTETSRSAPVGQTGERERHRRLRRPSTG